MLFEGTQSLPNRYCEAVVRSKSAGRSNLTKSYKRNRSKSFVLTALDGTCVRVSQNRDPKPSDA